MKKLRYIVGIIGALVLMASVGCVEKFEADISDLVAEGLVVEGNIISDSPPVATTFVFSPSSFLYLFVIPSTIQAVPIITPDSIEETVFFPMASTPSDIFSIFGSFAVNSESALNDVHTPGQIECPR